MIRGPLLGIIILFVLCACVFSQGDTGPVNINTASKDELDALPGIGPARAQAIINYRELYGPFQDTEEITKVYGIGKGIYAGLKDMITVGEGGGEAEEAPVKPAEKPREVRRRAKEEEKVPSEPARKPSRTKRVSTKTVTTTTERKAPSDSQQVFYRGKTFIPRGCWSCKEVFFIPDDLTDGWCPYCGKKWSVQ